MRRGWPRSSTMQRLVTATCSPISRVAASHLPFAAGPGSPICRSRKLGAIWALVPGSFDTRSPGCAWLAATESSWQSQMRTKQPELGASTVVSAGRFLRVKLTAGGARHRQGFLPCDDSEDPHARSGGPADRLVPDLR